LDQCRRVELAAQGSELLQGELQADGEEEQGDAKLANEFNIVDVFDESGDGGADDEPADDVADYERGAQEDGEVAADTAARMRITNCPATPVLVVKTGIGRSSTRFPLVIRSGDPAGGPIREAGAEGGLPPAQSRR